VRIAQDGSDFVHKSSQSTVYCVDFLGSGVYPLPLNTEVYLVFGLHGRPTQSGVLAEIACPIQGGVMYNVHAATVHSPVPDDGRPLT